MGSFLSLDDHDNNNPRDIHNYAGNSNDRSTDRRLANQVYNRNYERGADDRSDVNFQVIVPPMYRNAIIGRNGRQFGNYSMANQSFTSIHDNYIPTTANNVPVSNRRRRHYHDGERSQSLTPGINVSLPNSVPSSDYVCRMCNKSVPYDDVELHYAMCLTTPRVTYNDDVLRSDDGECSICLEDLVAGQAIARLPCLCIYHKKCIDLWFKKKQTCPEHPGD